MKIRLPMGSTIETGDALWGNVVSVCPLCESLRARLAVAESALLRIAGEK